MSTSGKARHPVLPGVPMDAHCNMIHTETKYKITSGSGMILVKVVAYQTCKKGFLTDKPQVFANRKSILKPSCTSINPLDVEKLLLFNLEGNA